MHGEECVAGLEVTLKLHHTLQVKDSSIPFMPRVEVVDARGGAHLGHVFNDGPPPSKFDRLFLDSALALIFAKGTHGEFKRGRQEERSRNRNLKENSCVRIVGR